jgi:hypothetical protein
MKLILTILSLCLSYSLLPVQIDSNNQLSSHLSLYEIASSQRYHTKFSFKPELDFQIYSNENRYIDSEFIWNIYYNFYTNDRQRIETNNIKLYRSWLRLATEQSELRLGRQKLNFGPALLLRSLRWFDKLDSRDPLPTTSGVDGGLFRHYFLNNSSLWFWILVADAKLKGNEFIASEANTLEYGFRLEYPFEYCESGLTFHMRQLDLETEEEITESRWGFDTRWDSWLGYWLELSVGIFADYMFLPRYEKSFTLGADYTINWKNGIYVLAEHAVQAVSEKEFFSSYDENNVTAMNLEYSLSFFTSIKAIVSYSWDTEDFSGSLIYNRSFNYLDLYLSLNFNPYIEDPDYDKINYDGTSLQLKAVYNFTFFK